MRLRELKKEKRTNNRLLLALILLLLIVAFSLKINHFNFVVLLPNYFQKLVTPIPSNDQITELTNILTERNISVEFPLILTESAILAKTADGEEFWFSVNKEFTPQVDSLQIILARLKIEGKKIKKVDLRYERPVVLY